MPWTATRDGEARAYRVGSTSVLTVPHVIKGAMSVRVRFTSREICNRIMISGRPAQVDRWHCAPPRVILRACCEYRTGWSVWIETVELDDRNIAHATTRVSAAEICECSTTIWYSAETGPAGRRTTSPSVLQTVVRGCGSTSSTTWHGVRPVPSAHGGCHDPEQASRRDERR